MLKITTNILHVAVCSKPCQSTCFMKTINPRQKLCWLFALECLVLSPMSFLEEIGISTRHVLTNPWSRTMQRHDWRYTHIRACHKATKKNHPSRLHHMQDPCHVRKEKDVANIEKALLPLFSGGSFIVDSSSKNTVTTKKCSNHFTTKSNLLTASSIFAIATLDVKYQSCFSHPAANSLYVKSSNSS